MNPPTAAVRIRHISRQRRRWRAIRRSFWLGAVDLANRLPRPCARALGRAVGHIVWRTMRAERERAVERICAALRCSRGEGVRLARRCSVTVGMYLADAVRLEVWSPSEVRRVIRLEGLHHLRQALSSGNGAFVLSAHVGNWELLAAAIADAGIPFAVIARRPDDPVLAARLEALRDRWNVRSLWRDDGARPILRALRTGKAVGVMIDQATATGVEVPFFGMPAHTSIGPARIAVRTGVPVVPVHCVDNPDGTYVGTFGPPVGGEGEERADPVALTARWTRHVERWIRQAPHTWVWMHDRWRRCDDQVSAGRRRMIGRRAREVAV